MEIFNKKILLNSHSPRRKQILESMGLDVKTVSSDCEETYPDNIPPEEVAVYLATKKCRAYKGDILPDEVLVSADTIVINGNSILGKPKNRQQALEMLKSLSGNTHKVITGCCLQSQNTLKSFYETTEVIFGELDDEEIVYYTDKYSPYDKAGAYGVQEWIGMTGIKGLKGDYYNVMGLPANKLWQQLKDLDGCYNE